MSLGRALREVLVIDSETPCNRQTPFSHNYLTQDGQPPEKIASLARKKVSEYDTIAFYDGLAINGNKTENGIEIQTSIGDIFTAKKLIFATGLQDIMPEIKGFRDCWGVSIIHCPYCHGYEVRNQKTGILANGDIVFHFVKLISNWTKKLMLFTNGKSTLSQEQTKRVQNHNIPIIEHKIERIEHENGHVKKLFFSDHPEISVDAVYAKPDFVQQCDIPEKLGCKLTDQKLIEVDDFQKNIN
jgi:thioredoxin reductase